MKMGDIATKLGEVRLDNMRGFKGMIVDKDALWKLLFSYSVGADGDSCAPPWVENLFRELTKPTISMGTTYKYTHASGVPFGHTMNDSTGELEKI